MGGEEIMLLFSVIATDEATLKSRPSVNDIRVFPTDSA